MKGLNIQAMASVVTSRVLSYFLTNSELKPRSRVRVQSVSGGDSKGLPSDSVQMHGASLIGEEEKNGMLIDRGIREKEKTGGQADAWNASLKCGVEKKCVKDVISSHLDVLWDDGYGTKTVKDYFEEAKEMIRPDGGPPRWFCPVECGQPLKDSPVLLFCPGLDGVGSALALHHKALGKVFEVRCLHIPVRDRTPFEGFSLPEPLNSSDYFIEFWQLN